MPLMLLAVISALMAACAGRPATTAPTTTATKVPVTTTAPRKGVVHEFVIPAGTAERIAKGEKVDIIPDKLTVRVGDKLRVRNEDSEFVRLGFFDVRPGETVSMGFNSPDVKVGVIYPDESAGCGPPPPDVQTFIVEILP